MYTPAFSGNTYYDRRLDGFLEVYAGEMWETNVADMSTHMYGGILKDMPGYQYFIAVDGDDDWQPGYIFGGKVQSSFKGGVEDGAGIKTGLNIAVY